MKKILLALVLTLVLVAPVKAQEVVDVETEYIQMQNQLISVLLDLVNQLQAQLLNNSTAFQAKTPKSVGSSEIMENLNIEIGAKVCTETDIIYPLEISGGEYGYVLREAEVTHPDGSKSGYNAEAINPFTKIVPPPFEGLKQGDVVDYVITVKTSEKGDVLGTKEGQLTIESCE